MNSHHLFDNPMIRSAKQSMSSEDQEQYRKVGEKMYNSINFETGKAIDRIDLKDEKLLGVIEALKSGLHPQYLTEEDKSVAKECYGEDWYKILCKRYGYL